MSNLGINFINILQADFVTVDLCWTYWHTCGPPDTFVRPDNISKIDFIINLEQILLI